MENYSVYMSVYYKENPQFFAEAVESMLNQTIKPNEIIIVCDGPLTEQLDKVLNDLAQNNSCIKIIRLVENKGRGYAAQIGLDACTNEIVLRMDSDDFSVPTRAEKLLNAIKDCDIVGGVIAEFSGDMSNVTGLRVLPLTHKEIVKFSKSRSPINNVTVAFRKSIIQNAGGYDLTLKYAEDYYLWIKAIQSGAICKNLKDILVYVRAGEEMVSRRNDDFYHAIKQLRKYMLKTKYINVFQYFFYNLIQWIVFHLPNKLKLWVYKVFLRKKSKRER